MTEQSLAEEFAALLEQHHGLENLLAFAIVSNAADLRRDAPDIADGMLAWAETVRETSSTAGWAGCCGGSDLDEEYRP
jgi:hypothetical protein